MKVTLMVFAFIYTCSMVNSRILFIAVKGDETSFRPNYLIGQKQLFLNPLHVGHVAPTSNSDRRPDCFDNGSPCAYDQDGKYLESQAKFTNIRKPSDTIPSRRQQQLVPAVSNTSTSTNTTIYRPIFAYRTANQKFNMTRAAVSNLVPHTEFLGFLRISKTASTSVLNLLGHTNGALSSANTFIAKQHYSKRRSGLQECIFAQSNNASDHSEHWKTETFHHGCPHPSYKFLKKHWLRSLPFLNEADGPAADVAGGGGGAHSYYLHPFTMIRDPFDRMVSFFYYMQWSYPDWTTTDAQDKLILADDFVGWMETVHKEGGTDIVAVPYQFEALDDDLDTAIDLITGEDPEVLVLLTACTNSSIQLLAEKKPKFFSSETVARFLKSPEASANKRRKKDAAKWDMTLMRRRHKKVFSKDWDFYAAALLQFRGELLSSMLSRSEVDSCIQKLDEIYEEIKIV